MDNNENQNKGKNAWKTVLIGIVILVVIGVAGRFGWKLAGFRACTGTGIESISVKENQVEIQGFYPGSFPEGYVGYVSKEEDGKLYIGVRYDAVFGCLDNGSFDITIPTDGTIKEIYLENPSEEWRIWNSENDDTEKTKGFFDEENKVKK